MWSGLFFLEQSGSAESGGTLILILLVYCFLTLSHLLAFLGCEVASIPENQSNMTG